MDFSANVWCNIEDLLGIIIQGCLLWISTVTWIMMLKVFNFRKLDNESYQYHIQYEKNTQEHTLVSG